MTKIQKLFGRVDKETGKVLEYNVSSLHVKNRHHSESMYTPVVVGIKPEVPPFHSLSEKVYYNYNDDKIYTEYSIVPIQLGDLLRQATISGDREFTREQEQQDVFFSQLDAALTDRIRVLFEQHIQDKLERFVKTKGYDSVLSAISYSSSAVPQFVADATRVKELRDQTWTAVLSYFNDINSDTKPVPTRVSEIDQYMPELTWE